MQRQLAYVLTRSHALAELNDSYALFGDQIRAILWTNVMGVQQLRVLTDADRARLQDLRWRRNAVVRRIANYLRRYFTN
jgi:hypothetical protein